MIESLKPSIKETTQSPSIKPVRNNIKSKTPLKRKACLTSAIFFSNTGFRLIVGLYELLQDFIVHPFKQVFLFKREPPLLQGFPITPVNRYLICNSLLVFNSLQLKHGLQTIFSCFHKIKSCLYFFRCHIP